MATVSPMSDDHRNGPMDDAARPRLWSLILPALLLISALVLPQYLFWRGEPAVPQGLGPGFWPRLMLHGVALCAAIWLLGEIHALWRGRPAILSAPTEDETYRLDKALVGIGLILAYGWLLHLTGFALTTAAFLMIWCVYGGVRNPLVFVPVALIGTAALLWVFMGAALMPLSRGQGIFDTISIWILQMLRIY